MTDILIEARGVKRGFPTSGGEFWALKGIDAARIPLPMGKPRFTPPTVGGCLRTDGADLGKYQTITDIFDMGRFQSSRNRLKVKIVVIKMRLTFRDTKESSILGTL